MARTGMSLWLGDNQSDILVCPVLVAVVLYTPCSVRVEISVAGVVQRELL